MKIGFLIIGSEILDGKITDQNTKSLAEFLRGHHLEINESLVARDQKEAIERCLQQLFQNNDVIITSGGLGPTRDDITKETLAFFLNRKIVLSSDAIKISQDNYSRFGREFPGSDHGYSYLPEGFHPLSNSTGFAPGFFTKHENKILFSAPGVPREFKSMIMDHLLSAITEKLNHSFVLKHYVVRTKNIPEEKIFGEVDPHLWERLEKFGEVSSLPIIMGVDIGVKVKARDKLEMELKVNELEKIFKASPIVKNIWSYDFENIEEKIVRLSNSKNIKFGFAESATGGLCSHRITSISGSSHSFIGSVICYDESIKQNIVGVSTDTLKKYSAVSAQTAKEMAKGLLEKFHLDVAISITGFAGPSGGTKECPVGSVFIGKATSRNGEVFSDYFLLRGDREILKQRFSQAALYALLDEVENFS